VQKALETRHKDVEGLGLQPTRGFLFVFHQFPVWLQLVSQRMLAFRIFILSLLRSLRLSYSNDVTVAKDLFDLEYLSCIFRRW